MNELTAALGRIIPKTVEGTKRAIVGAAFVAMDRSPRFTGQLRASTKIGFNEPDFDIVRAPSRLPNSIPNAEIIALTNFNNVIDDYKAGDTVFISNNNVYAWTQEVERGHHMYSIAAHSFQSELDSGINAAK